MALTRLVRWFQAMANAIAAPRSIMSSRENVIDFNDVRRHRNAKPNSARPSLTTISLVIQLGVIFGIVILIGAGTINFDHAPLPWHENEDAPRRSPPPPASPPPDQRSSGGFTISMKGFEGPGYVIDGDTLAAGTMRIRLHGIDAPEIGQTCESGQMVVACGVAAADMLRTIVAGARINCDAKETDRYARDIATCFLSDGTNINEQMVASGWALAYRRYTHVYDRAEGRARSRGLGLWSSEFQSPETWRSQQR